MSGSTVRKLISFAAVLGVLSCVRMMPAVGSIYSVTNLGYLHPPLSQVATHASAMNNSKQIAGWGWAGSAIQAIEWQNGAITPIAPPWSSALAINSTGGTVGWFQADTGNPFYWDNATGFQPLAYSPWWSGAARGINDAGEIVGYAGDLRTYAVLWENASAQPIALPGLGSSTGVYANDAYAINSAEQIVGKYVVSYPPYHWHAERWVNRSPQDLFPGDPADSQANAINDAGEIVGVRENHAFWWQDGNWGELPALPGGAGTSEAFAINASGLIVGTSSAADGNNHAVLWENGTIVDLNNYLDPSGAGWTLFEARAINDFGFIAGTGIVPGAGSGFLLSPVPEPSSIAIWGIVAISVLAFAWRRKRRG